MFFHKLRSRRRQAVDGPASEGIRRHKLAVTVGWRFVRDVKCPG